MDGWLANGWKKANGRPVEETPTCGVSCLQAAEPHRVTWEWIRGHRGNPLNERADQLAREARQRLESGQAVPTAVTTQSTALPEVRCTRKGVLWATPGPAATLRSSWTPKGASSRFSALWPMATSNVMELWAAVAGLQALQAGLPCYGVQHEQIPDRRGRALAGPVGAPRLAHSRRSAGFATRRSWAELLHVLGDHDVTWAHLENANRNTHYRQAVKLARQAAEGARG